MQTFLSEVLESVKQPKKLALGYPVNRQHAFKIDLKQLGIIKNSFSNTFMNNVGIPNSKKLYRIDDIKEVEEKVINLVSNHLGLPKNEEFGYVTSGGTEANFAAIWWHREYLANKFKQKPVLMGSESSHYSIDKIANQLQLELIKLDANNLEHDLELKLKSIKCPVIYWANIGATTDGAIDDISKITVLLKKHSKNRYRIHGDGAIYGLLVPYIKKFNFANSIFDVIDSISISGHKFLGAYNICGIVLARQSYIEQVFALQDKKISYVRNAVDYTVSGSRPGLHIIELYLLLQQATILDKSGKTNLENLWNKCLNRAYWFHKKLQIQLGLNDLISFKDCQLSLSFPAPKNETEKLELSKKYSLMPIGNKQLGAYIFPSVTISKLRAFLADYGQIKDFEAN